MIQYTIKYTRIYITVPQPILPSLLSNHRTIHGTVLQYSVDIGYCVALFASGPSLGLILQMP